MSAHKASTYTYPVPRSLLVNANQRGKHWAPKARNTAELRRIARIIGRAFLGPQSTPCHVLITIGFPDRRRRDHANWAPTSKAVVDGLTDAGCWDDDNADTIDGPDTRVAYDPSIIGQRVSITIKITPKVAA